MSTARYLASRFKGHIPLKYAYAADPNRQLYEPQQMPPIKERLPSHYMKFYREWSREPQTPIHYRPRTEKYYKDEFGQVQKVVEQKIPVIYPDEFHQGLWGGEGVLKGLQEPPPTKHKPNYTPPTESYYWPKLFQGVVYSEVLDKHIEVIMTARAQRLIDESYGLDYYLLKTPVNEIYSWLGLKIKREILLTLAQLMEEGKNDELVHKYENWIIPHQEALWHGLPLAEAIHRQLVLERIANDQRIVPKKIVYRKELHDKLKQGLMDELDPDILYMPPLEDSAMSKVFKTIKEKIQSQPKNK